MLRKLSRKLSRNIITALILLTAPLVAPAAHAFPDRPIKLVVSSPAGGPPDIIAPTITFTKPGTYTYVCLVHPKMGGVVKVT